MPIPSLSPATTSRSQLHRTQSISTRSERLGEPGPDEHGGGATASNPLRKHSDSQIPPHEQASGDVAKKRSFLPQRGLPKPIGRAVGAAEPGASRTRQEIVNSKQAASSMPPPQARPRPRSLYQTRGKEQVTAVGTAGVADSPDTITRAPISAGLSRTQSLRQPGFPSQASPAATRRIHTRTQSTSTAIDARKETTEVDHPIRRTERPKSLVAAPTHTRPSGSVSTEAASGVARSIARLDSIQRSASTRSKATIPHGRATSSTLDGSGPNSQSSDGREGLKQEPKRSARPAFSTLQQHFTPRKAGKAPTSAFLHAPEPTNHVFPPEIISLQNELLQLHLLHESSALTNKQWESSAHKALQMKFDEVASLNELMQEKERYGQEQKNLLALRDWSGSNSLSGLVEYIQALSGPLHELPSLLDPGGRFFHLVEAYGMWFLRVDEVWSGRREPPAQRSVMHSLEGLGDSWRGEHAAMTRKLTAFARHLDGLPPTVKGSSIAHIVSRCQSLVDGLLSELQVMQVTEAVVVAREKRWVEGRLRNIAQDVEVQPEADEEAWRLY